MDVERLIKLAGQLGLKGEPLREWVEKAIKEEDERKEKDRLAATELARVESERIREQTALLNLELELQRRREEAPAPTSQAESPMAPAFKTPRLPCFDDSRDSIDSFLLRFERHARANGWAKKDWGTFLSALLRGAALEVYSRLSDEEAVNYEIVKEQLLKRYNLTEEGFLSRFRNSRPEASEMIGQFRNRAETYLTKYVELSGKDKESAADLWDLLLREQLLCVCGKDMLVFLKERKPATADDVVDLISKYTEAHGTSGAYSRPGPAPSLKHGGPVNRSQLQPNEQRGQVNANSRIGKPIVCHNCNKPGHIAKDCRSRQRVAAMADVVVCGFCKKRGHETRNCWAKQRKEKEAESNRVAALCPVGDTGNDQCRGHEDLQLSCGCKMPITSAVCLGREGQGRMPVCDGVVDHQTPVSVLRDSGSSCVVIRRGLVRNEEKGKKVPILLADGSATEAPTVQVHLQSPYFTGTVKAVEMQNPLYDVILGNIKGARCPGMCQEGRKVVLAVETRGSKLKNTKPLVTPRAPNVDVTTAELKAQQSADESLKQVKDLAASGEVRYTGKGNETRYKYDDGILYRHFKSPQVHHGNMKKQVVVPQGLRETVMKLAHESILAGHLAAKKTTERILEAFYWPSMWRDVHHFCRSCDVCQRCAPKGKTPKVPLQEMPLIDTPFSRVAVDLVGPIRPASERGYCYILTVVCYCTRYPEAVPLKNITTEAVAEGLVDIFSRTGVPKEILSDRGTQFTSELMAEVCRLLSIRQLMTTPYHPQCNGLVEKYNGTLKAMLKRLSTDRPRDWDRYLNAALFAYREAPQDSLGFSPFELLFGRTVRGPMTILKELWTKDIEDPEVKTTYQYVVDLNEKIEATIKVAHENLVKSGKRYRAYFDRRAKPRSFEVGDKVLLLLPTKQNKLELKWQGPFEVVCQTNTNNYRINVRGTEKVYHVNLLKKYFEREPETGHENEQVGLLMCAAAAVVEESDESIDVPALLELPSLQQTETVADVSICNELKFEQRKELSILLDEHKDVLTDIPGRTNLFKYNIKLTSSVPVRKRPYPVPQAMRETLKEEVRGMLKAGIIEPSESPYCSPSVVVRKKDGTNRYCVDFRALNNITVFDAEPMPQLDDLFQQIGQSCEFVSKLDLSKGYWQVALSEESKPLTAFATDLGLMSFTVMPFGLQCAPAAFSRLMRIVLRDLDNVKNFIDDIIVHTKTWSEHMDALRKVFQRLRDAGLTARPTKCLIGFRKVEFLGHIIGGGRLAPTIDKVEAIQKALPPVNKKQLRSFLGLASFYRRYVPNFAAVTCPLTDATRKGKPNKLIWDESMDRAFNYIKERLSSEPVLRLPDFSKVFILATDASDNGLGAVLMQEHDGTKFPIIYLSRKLLQRERNYSVIEKECLALVWAVKTLSTYLIGREFVVETDHAPLLYLNRAKNENGRLMRWSLLLHQYRFQLRSVQGKDNHGPDYLSRQS